jgi:hypothetical protein
MLPGVSLGFGKKKRAASRGGSRSSRRSTKRLEGGSRGGVRLKGDGHGYIDDALSEQIKTESEPLSSMWSEHLTHSSVVKVHRKVKGQPTLIER